MLNVYYDLYEILGSIEVVADALKEFQKVDKPRRRLIEHLENLRLEPYELELNALYDMDIRILRAYALRKNKYHIQSEIWDFLV